MSTALQIQTDFTPAQLKLITETVARGATQDELQLFLYRCKSMGFDPLKSGQIHFVKYGNGPGTIVVGIDGFRARAMRSGKLSGIKRGAIKDAKGLVGAWAEVYRSDWQHPARTEVSLAEYSTGKGPWSKMPETMILKVAECAALRMAFPDDLGGVYAAEEMDQAKEQHTAPSPISQNLIPQRRIAPDQPGAEDGVQDPGNFYFPPSHKDFPNKTVKQIFAAGGPEPLHEYLEKVKYVEAQGRALAKSTVAARESILAFLENMRGVEESPEEADVP